MTDHHCDIAIIGAGIVGIATAYYLKQIHPNTCVILVDAGDPMALTTAHSGENYRNWWPHPTMTAFTDRSIDLMEDLAKQTNNLFNMTRRGYVLATRSDNTDTLINELEYGYSQLQNSDIRIHQARSTQTYRKQNSAAWQTAPSGVDILKNKHLISSNYPSYDHSINLAIHIRRAGAISAQQLGQHMLQHFKLAGGSLIRTEVNNIHQQDGFKLHSKNAHTTIKAQQIVNAAGPFIQQVADMLSIKLPVQNTLQQKIAFKDSAVAIPRDMPFSIDLDAQQIDWTDQERELLQESDDHNWLTKELPGSIHCRPEGPDNGTWLKIGWAFNDTATTPSRTPALLDAFPEIVLRGAARLNPALKHYYSRMPRAMHHYGGFYTVTEENWPLVGLMDPQEKLQGAYVAGAMSGFGTMAACAAGELCARLMLAAEPPHYANSLSPQRYTNTALMDEIHALTQKGIL